PQFGGKTQVQDRFPGHETVLWKQGSAPDPSWQGSRNRVDPKPVGKDGRLHLQRDLRIFAGRSSSRLRSDKAGDLFLKGRGAYCQGLRREDRAACLGGFRRLPQGPGRRHPVSLRRKALNSSPVGARDRKSTRLNSSHRTISYAVFCLKKKNITT